MMKQRSPRISKKLWWGAALVASLLLLWGSQRAPERPKASAPAPEAPEEPALSLPLREVEPAPEARKIYIEGQGLATVEPLTDADHAPPPIDALPSAEPIPIPEELPQTPAWKLKKVERMRELMARRAETLEEEASAAKARGDTEEAARKQVIATRLRDRLPTLDAQAKALRAKIASE